MPYRVVNGRVSLNPIRLIIRPLHPVHNKSPFAFSARTEVPAPLPENLNPVGFIIRPLNPKPDRVQKVETLQGSY